MVSCVTPELQTLDQLQEDDFSLEVILHLYPGPCLYSALKALTGFTAAALRDGR
jgi:hypothetical protein